MPLRAASAPLFALRFAHPGVALLVELLFNLTALDRGQSCAVPSFENSR